jgi:hypothetical protein
MPTSSVATCAEVPTTRQLVARPRVRRPYRTGVHGMCGQLAALAALADLGAHDLDQELVR